MKSDRTMYPTAPGTIAGAYDPEKYQFRNLSYQEVYCDLEAFWTCLKEVNPGARMLLTVSPVPLIATASESHILVANTYSKSVLRAVAGGMVSSFREIHYFPSYEIIATHPSRGMFYNPDLRTVNQAGVDYVMRHFFSGPLGEVFSSANPAGSDDLDIVCDEEAIEGS